jgi:PhoH-like ATPase
MHDPLCLFRFEEHDIFLPMITLEELDSHKRA